MKCIVCNLSFVKFYKVIDKKIYWKCTNCLAKFLDKSHYLSKNAEKNHYLKHENSIDDSCYINFLSKLYLQIKEKISTKGYGLDFGCGYVPALANIFEKNNFSIDIYDPFFFPNRQIFNNKYNFITCSEAAEHFFNPYKEFNKINSLLKENGWLGVMTSFLTEEKFFDNWHYRRDPTHVVFYDKKTFQVIASQRNWEHEIRNNNIVLFNKTSS